MIYPLTISKNRKWFIHLNRIWVYFFFVSLVKLSVKIFVSLFMISVSFRLLEMIIMISQKFSNENTFWMSKIFFQDDDIIFELWRSILGYVSWISWSYQFNVSKGFRDTNDMDRNLNKYNWWWIDEATSVLMDDNDFTFFSKEKDRDQIYSHQYDRRISRRIVYIYRILWKISFFIVIFLPLKYHF